MQDNSKTRRSIASRQTGYRSIEDLPSTSQSTVKKIELFCDFCKLKRRMSIH